MKNIRKNKSQRMKHVKKKIGETKGNKWDKTNKV